jgi:uncharacterized protein YjgD (DUF1641 family)
VLARIEARLSRIEGALEPAALLADKLPALVAITTDVIDETMNEAAAQGLELALVADELKRLVFGLLRLTTSSELKSALESGMLEPRALQALGKVAGALVEVSSEPPARVGAFGALRALRDDDVQRALGFLLQLAQRFGRALAEDDGSTKQLSA